MAKKEEKKVWRNLKGTLEELKYIISKYDTFVFFDTETTGLHPGEDKVIQLSGIKTNRNLETIKVYNEYANPSPNVISAKITEITGITNADVENARPEREVLEDFLIDTQGCAYFAYNSNFDVNMVTKSMQNYGISVEMTHFDVLKIARDVLANESIENHKLKTVSDFLGVTPEGENFHNALFDVQSTIEVFKALVKRAKTMEVANGNARPKVFSIRPWEIGLNKRLYIQTAMGSVWFDKIKQTWGTKDAPIDELDMGYIESMAIKMAQDAGFETLQRVNKAI